MKKRVKIKSHLKHRFLRDEIFCSDKNGRSIKLHLFGLKLFAVAVNRFCHSRKDRW